MIYGLHRKHSTKGPESLTPPEPYGKEEVVRRCDRCDCGLTESQICHPFGIDDGVVTCAACVPLVKECEE